MKPIVLVHGFWVTPRSWEHWITHYEAKGHQVIAPGYPGFEVEVEALNADPTPIVDVTVPQIIAHYERYAIPASGGILWGGVLANFQPSHQDTWVDYHNDNRAPLLFVSGSEDHIMPPEIQKSNAKHYKSSTITERKEYEGYAHLLPAQKGWEQIADEVLDWALQHAK